MTVATPDHSTATPIPCLVDTGADITAIPSHLIGVLELIKFSEIEVGGFRHEPELVDTYLVGLWIHDWKIEAVEVVLSDDNSGVLGRDVLNDFLITLDGPDRALTIERAAHKTDNSTGE